MTKPVCTVMVGLPAMGKSTRVTAFATMNPNVFVYSPKRLFALNLANRLWRRFDV